MKIKQRIANAFVNFTHGWNIAIHNAIERKVFDGYHELFPNNAKDGEKAGEFIDSMRKYYYQRMMNTASLLLTGISLIVALIALIVAIIALRH